MTLRRQGVVSIDIDAAIAKARAEGAAETQREIVAWLRERAEQYAPRDGRDLFAMGVEAALTTAADMIERTTFTGRASVEPTPEEER